jgi:2,3-bisphosphoglycerate-independent phosphoglycerate mutase
VPVLLWGERVGQDDQRRYGERWCQHGALGLRPLRTLMPLMLAAAGRLGKFGG